MARDRGWRRIDSFQGSDQGSLRRRWPWCASQRRNWPGLQHSGHGLSLDGGSSRDAQLDLATWRQIEDGAQRLRSKGRSKGGEVAQFVARTGAAFCGAPVNEEGRASNAAGILLITAGGWEKCAGESWAWIEAGWTKQRNEVQKAGHITQTETHHQAALAAHHSHICKSPLCVRGCTPTTNDRGYVHMTHTCMDPSNRRRPDGLGLHLCRQCHQSGTVCKTAVCKYGPWTGCSHLHT